MTNYTTTRREHDTAIRKITLARGVNVTELKIIHKLNVRRVITEGVNGV